MSHAAAEPPPVLAPAEEPQHPHADEDGAEDEQRLVGRYGQVADEGVSAQGADQHAGRDRGLARSPPADSRYPRLNRYCAKSTTASSSSTAATMMAIVRTSTRHPPRSKGSLPRSSHADRSDARDQERESASLMPNPTSTPPAMRSIHRLHGVTAQPLPQYVGEGDEQAEPDEALDHVHEGEADAGHHRGNSRRQELRQHGDVEDADLRVEQVREEPTTEPRPGALRNCLRGGGVRGAGTADRPGGSAPFPATRRRPRPPSGARRRRPSRRPAAPTRRPRRPRPRRGVLRRCPATVAYARDRP